MPQQQQQLKLRANNNKSKNAKNVDANNQQQVEESETATTKGKSTLYTSMEQLKVQPPPNVSRQNAGSNWNALRNITQEAVNSDTMSVNSAEISSSPTTSTASLSKSARQRLKHKERKAAHRNRYLAMDCEMVGVGLNGVDDMLARVSIVNKQGEVLLDKFVKPRETVTDYRTSVSGVRPRDMELGEDFDVVQEEVVQMLQGKILIGHAIRNDLAVLHIKHPYANIRDTSRYKPLCRMVANGRTPSLKRLTLAILGQEIQTGEHNSVEDARAAMNIYNRLSEDWEKYIQKHQHKFSK